MANAPQDNSSSTPVSPLIHDDNNTSSPDQPRLNLVDFTTVDTKLKFEDAIRNNSLNELETLLQSKEDLLNIPIEHRITEGQRIVTLKLTPLSFAATLGHSLALAVLLDHVPDVDAQIPHTGIIALHLASRYGYKDCVKLLLSKGAKVNLQDQRGWGPLHYAARYGKQEVITCLLDEEAKPDLRNNKGDTPFHTAATYGNLDSLKLLYQRGSEKSINEANNLLNTPLHLAILNSGDDAVEWLLSSGALVNQPGYEGNTPLIMATTTGKVELITLLIRSGANIHQTNNKLQTPLLVACQNQNLEIVDKLKQYGALVTDVDQDGDNCFHMAIWSEKESPETARTLFSRLVSYGTDINQQNKNGYTPLALACHLQLPPHVKSLLEFDAEINKEDITKGTTALMEACGRPDDQIVDILLERNADMTIRDNHGLTALSRACDKGRLNQVKALLRKGSKAVVSDKDRDTPLRIALHHGYIEIALELLAAEEYYPRSLAAKISSPNQIDDVERIKSLLLEHFGNAKFETPEQLHAVMYWAVSNGSRELADKCINHDNGVLQWNREGNTWLHVAADSGALEIVRLLLTKVAEERDKPAEWANAEAIVKRNIRGDSPLTISIERGHDGVRELFWSKLKQLGNTKADFVNTNPTVANWVLELLAQYERPGHERILMELLQKWYGEANLGPDDTALHWAVLRRKVLVVWWLLSKGGYSTGEIGSALELVLEDITGVCDVIRELLLHPPPLLEHVPNPNKVHTATSGSFDDITLNSLGHIVDIVFDGKSVKIPYIRPRVGDIIAEAGLESLMKSAQDDLGQYELNVLRKDWEQTAPDQDDVSGTPVGDWVRSMSSRQNIHRQDLLVRWIHLPVNDLYLMRVSIILVNQILPQASHTGPKGTSKQAITRFKPFGDRLRNLDEAFRSKLERASRRRGQALHEASMCSMYARLYRVCCRSSPPSQQQQSQAKQNGHSNRTPSESDISKGYNGCIALYIPYLTVGSYEPSTFPPPVTATPQEFDGSTYGWSSRRIKHMPLTLDQYYYPTVSDTSKRDNDQVLSRFLHKKGPQTGHGRHVAPHANKKILMVNHLWVWIIDEKTIITATSDISNREAPKSLREITGGLVETTLRHILYNKDRVFEGAVSVEYIMEVILGAATRLFTQKSIVLPDTTLRGPIEVFRESIRDVANHQTSLFMEFLKRLQQEPGGQGQAPNDELDSKAQGKSVHSNPHHVISAEMTVLESIRDIRDELNILKSLAEDQEVVWKQAFASIYPEKESQFGLHTPAEVKRDLDAMLLEARNIEDYITNLLDLRQADYSREQADVSGRLAADSAQQSRVIFIFTVITIVFLPLSFLSSLFAIDVSVFPHEGENLRYQGWWLFPILFGVTVIVSTPTIAFAWNVDAVSAWFRKLATAIAAKFNNTVAFLAVFAIRLGIQYRRKIKSQAGGSV
ncbi:hypothetical protein ANO14919_088880 [Xylariales sp. No.14919]|nr:hypothetical protein ANO14919_088880 [Xylariales sp. No.14919]